MNYGKKGVRQKKRNLSSTSSKIGHKFSVNLLKIALAVFIAVIVCIGCVVAGMIKGVIDSAPDVASINVTPTGFATKVYDNQGSEIQSLVASGSNRTSKDIEDIPVDLQHAFVVLEDERFYEHNGIDVRGIVRAGAEAVKNFRLSQGASTITQQLLKNNVFNAYNESTSEKIKRKIQEQYLAIKLESAISKEIILENYLNTINLGNGYLGVQSAAEGYFDKDVSELTLSECAVIASITQNPSGYNPIKYPEKNQRRQQVCLQNLLNQGYITKSAYDEAIADDVYSRIQNLHADSTASAYSYFVDELITQLSNDLQTQKGYSESQALNLIYKGGLSVYSTQDSNMQSIADNVLNDPANWPTNTYISISYALTVTDKDGKKHNYSQLSLQKYFQTTGGKANFSLTFQNEEEAQKYVDQYREAILSEGNTLVAENLSFNIQPQVSFSLMDQKTGEVKVIVGGRGDKTGNRTLNRATATTRQPGSSIKPLAVYGPALDLGNVSLATAIDDAPFYYSGAEAQLVTNYEKDYWGLTTVRTALKRSRNVPAVKILSEITPQVGFTYLQRFGLTTLVAPKQAINGMHDVVQSLALGGMTKGVTNIDMTAAYCAIANGGTYTKPIYYTQVYDNNGTLLLDNSQKKTNPVLKKTTAWILTNGMEDVVKSGTGTKAAIANQPVAGKTGTTNADGDIWFCGFTPYYTASIWIGFDDNTTMKTSNYQHCAMWSKIMTQIHKSLQTKTFEQPSGIVELSVCSQSGKLAVPGLCDADPRGSQIISEYFAQDSQPKDVCDAHIIVNICNVTGMVAGPTCTDVSAQIKVKKSSADTLKKTQSVEDTDEYPVADEEYAVTDSFLNTPCTGHIPGIITPGVIPGQIVIPGATGVTTPTNTATQPTTKATTSSVITQQTTAPTGANR